MGSLLDIKQQVKEGSMSGALSAAKAAVRSAPSDPVPRSALFALLAANGEQARASEQLETCLSLGGGASLVIYSVLLAASRERDAVMTGESAPRFPNDEVPAWAPAWQAALAALHRGDPALLAAAAAARADDLSKLAGFNAEYEFEGFRHCDTRLCGCFEGIFNGRYSWLPLENVLRIAVPERPELLQDLVWLPVMVHLRRGEPLQGFLFATSPGTAEAGGEAEKLARTTTWDESHESVDLSRGVQLFMLGSEVLPVFSLGQCCFHAPGGTTAPEATSTAS